MQVTAQQQVTLARACWCSWAALISSTCASQCMLQAYQLGVCDIRLSSLCSLSHACIGAGGPDGVKGVATKLIEQHQLDDTFYIVDLANVVRLFKV